MVVVYPNNSNSSSQIKCGSFMDTIIIYRIIILHTLLDQLYYYYVNVLTHLLSYYVLSSAHP